MAARKGLLKPKADKQIKVQAAEIKAAPNGECVVVASIGSVVVRGDVCLVSADGKTQTIKGGKASIIIEG